jgi:hypothetical protein
MLDHEEKIINAQNRVVNIQFSKLIVLGFILLQPYLPGMVKEKDKPMAFAE